MSTSFLPEIDQTTFCEFEPFGADFIDTEGVAVRAANYPEAAAELTALQQTIRKICLSTHPDDLKFADNLNQNIIEQVLPFWPDRADEIQAATPIDWLGSASHERLLEFIVHNAELQRDNQSALAAMIPELTEAALSTIEAAIQHNVLKPGTVDIARQALQVTTFTALDAFESAEQDCSGMYAPGDNFRGTMGISDTFDNWQDEIALRKVFTHETLHAKDVLNKMGLRRFLRDLPITPLADELWVEHVTQVGYHGEPQIINPELRTWGRGTYLTDRIVGSMIFSVIDLELIVDAAAEPYDRWNTPARKALNRQLRRSFGEYKTTNNGSIFHVITAQLQARPRADNNIVLTEWINRLNTYPRQPVMKVVAPTFSMAKYSADDNVLPPQ